MHPDGCHGEGGDVHTAHLYGWHEKAEKGGKGPIGEHRSGAHKGNIYGGRNVGHGQRENEKIGGSSKLRCRADYPTDGYISRKADENNERVAKK